MTPPPWKPTPALARSLRGLFNEIEEESAAIRAQLAKKQDDLDIIRDSLLHIHLAAIEAVRQIDDPGLVEKDENREIGCMVGDQHK